jgi:hypothetical protein
MEGMKSNTLTWVTDSSYDGKGQQTYAESDGSYSAAKQDYV